MVGDFYNVEVKELSKEEYAMRFTQAYGSEMFKHIAPLENFVSCFWKVKQPINAIQATIESWLMPTGNNIKEKLTGNIMELIDSLFKKDMNLHRGRQVHDGLIQVDVTYQFAGESKFSSRLLFIELTLKQ